MTAEAGSLSPNRAEKRPRPATSTCFRLISADSIQLRPYNRHRLESAGMIAPPIFARFASGSGGRSARGLTARSREAANRPKARNFWLNG
jgi:hypothetical protein